MRWIGLLLCVGCADPASVDLGPGESTVVASDTAADPDDRSWTLYEVDQPGGLQLQLDLTTTGSPVLAFWDEAVREDGLCTEVEVAPPRRRRRALWMASFDEGVFELEEVAAPVIALQPEGISLEVQADGTRWLAYTGGEPEGQYCGAHDAVVANRAEGGVWRYEVAAADSDDVITGEPASDAGFVVGLWPALALDNTGEPAVLYRDAHFGALQRDDRFRADAELARRSGGDWAQYAVDMGQGAGDLGALLFDDQQRPVTFYVIPVEAVANSRLGLWAARLDEGVWKRVQLYEGDVPHRVSAALDAQGLPAVSWYAEDQGRARVARLTDASAFDDLAAWDSEGVGGELFDEGQHVSLAFDEAGSPHLAWHRCRRLTDGGTSCVPGDEAVVWATQEAGAWRTEVVYEGEGSGCGDYTQISLPMDGRVILAWRCAVLSEGSWTFRPQLAIGVP